MRIIALLLAAGLITGCASDGSVDWQRIGQAAENLKEWDDERTGKSKATTSSSKAVSCSLYSNTPAPNSTINGVASKFICTYDCGPDGFRAKEDNYCMNYATF